MTTTTSFWQRFAAMTEEEAKAERTAEIARLENGEMSDDECRERIEAWKQAARWQTDQAALLTQAQRLAHATGCPNDTSPVTWLIDNGYVVERDGGYAFTDKAQLLR